MGVHTTIDDRDLLLQVAEGNERAFDTLYHRYSKKVYTFAFRILRSDTLAEEVMQETLLKIWLLDQKTAEITNLEGYIRTAARHISLNLLRRQEIERRAVLTLKADWQDDHCDTEERVLLNDAQRILEEAVQLLPPKQQQAFRLCHQQGLKYEEAATVMGIAHQTVAVHVKLALRFVRAYIKKAAILLPLLVVLCLLTKK